MVRGRRQVSGQSAQHGEDATATASAALSRRDALRSGAASVAWLLALGSIGPEVAAELGRLALGAPMTGARLADILRAERATWDALLARVGPDQMEVPGVEGEWSVKEIVAHLMWYERAVLDGARQVVTTGTFTRPGERGEMAGLSMDERNERVAAASRPRPLADVLAEADRVFEKLLAIISACPDDILNDASLLGLPDDLPPWIRVANSSYGHYREHVRAIESWLATAR
jgi:hypothetical protein